MTNHSWVGELLWNLGMDLSGTFATCAQVNWDHENPSAGIKNLCEPKISWQRIKRAWKLLLRLKALNWMKNGTLCDNTGENVVHHLCVYILSMSFSEGAVARRAENAVGRSGNRGTGPLLPVITGNSQAFQELRLLGGVLSILERWWITTTREGGCFSVLRPGPRVSQPPAAATAAEQRRWQTVFVLRASLCQHLYSQTWVGLLREQGGAEIG